MIRAALLLAATLTASAVFGQTVPTTGGPGPTPPFFFEPQLPLIAGASGGGFLAGGTGQFVVSNYSKNSNDFTTGTGSWPVQNGGGAAAITTSTVSGVTLPDSTTGSVTQISIPAVTAGSSAYTVIQATDTHSLGLYPTTHGIWGKVVSGTGTPYTSITVSSTFFSNPITNDGAWHQVVNATVPHLAGNDNLQIGVNEFDPAQRVGTTAMTVYLTGDYWVGSQYAPIMTYALVKTGGVLATTGAEPVQTQITAPLPAHTAYRDPAQFTPYPGNPFLSESSTEVWRSGGVSNPFIQSQFQYGGFYWAFTNCTSSATEADWLSLCLMKSTDGLNWTEDTLNAPYLQAPGSIFANPTISGAGSGFTSGSGTATWTGSVTNCGVSPVIAVTVASTTISATTPSPNNGLGTGSCLGTFWPVGAQTTWSYSGVGAGSGASFTFASVEGTAAFPAPSYYVLHPSFLPYGCNDGTTAHTFCILFSALNGVATPQNIFMAWSNTIDGVYTPLGCAGPGMCPTATPVSYGGNLPGAANSGLVSVINVGGATGTNYVYSTTNGNFFSQANIVVWSTPANSAITTSGNTLTFKTYTSQTLDSGLDWYSPNASSGFEDPFIFLNHCGYYEMDYTIENPSSPGAPFTNSAQQIVSQAITNDPSTGTWWLYPAVIIPTNSSLYGGTLNIGDLAGVEIGGQYILTMNYDNGTTHSRAVAITAPQGVCP